MPTAQELLDQVDALMRRNRALEAEKATPSGAAESAPPTPPQPAPAPVPAPASSLAEPEPEPAPASFPAAAPAGVIDEVPVLTEVVADFGPVVGSETPLGGDDDARWRALADDVRATVLREFGLSDEAGSRGELDRRLVEFADRAADEIATSLRGQLETLLRDCVTEAIERALIEARRRG